MEKIKKYWHIICFNSHKYKNFDEIKLFLEWEIFKDICNNLEEKTIIVLGWDGTMLKAIKQNYKLQLPFLWINYWNKWFLLNDKNYIKISSKYKKIKYPIIEVKSLIKWEEFNDIFVNEINVNAWWWKMIELDISISSNKHINIKWDWIVISTPIWSTWYNSSLKWPILPHNLEVLVITPKAPWLPIWQNPIILDNNIEIDIKNSWRNNILEVYCDWRKLVSSWENWIEINVKKSKIYATFLIENDYLETWNHKIYIEQGFK